MSNIKIYVINSVLESFYSTYIEPWKNIRRTAIYAASIVGTAGATCIMTVSPFSYATQGQSELLWFSIAFFASMGTLFFPVIYLLLSIADSRLLRASLAVFEIAAFFVLLRILDNPLLTGLALAAVTAPYFCAYHVAMFRNTSERQRSFQVVLAKILSTLSGAGAGFAAGWWANAYGEMQTVLVAGAVAMTCATLGLFVFCPIRTRRSPRFFALKVTSMVIRSPLKVMRWGSLGIANGASFLTLSLLYCLGYSALNMGILTAISIAITAIFAPLFGKLMRRGNEVDFRLSCGLFALSWLLPLFGHAYPAVIFTFVVLNRVFVSFMFIAAETKIYGNKSYPVLAMYELVLGIGRTVGVAVFVPLLFASPHLYISSVTAVVVLLFAVEFCFSRR